MRRLRGRNGFRSRQQLLGARAASARSKDSHDRRRGQRRDAARRSAGIPHAWRCAVRHLHAGDDPRGRKSFGAALSAGRIGNPRGSCRKSLPLHRIHQDFRVCSRGNPRGGAVALRSDVPAYELEAPQDLAAALARIAREPGVWRPFAGGTDLMVLLEAGKLPHRKFLSIWKLAELRGIEATPEQVTLGALTTYSEIRRHELLAREFPLLCRAAAETGSIATQNRGTLGGNIANASPAADSPPALLVYDAELELVSSS